MNNFEKIMTIVMKNEEVKKRGNDYSFELPMLFIQDNKVYMALITTFKENEIGVITFCFQDGSVKYYTKDEFVSYKVVTINQNELDSFDNTFVDYKDEDLINDFSSLIDSYINEKKLDVEGYNNYIAKVVKSTKDQYGKVYISKFRI